MIGLGGFAVAATIGIGDQLDRPSFTGFETAHEAVRHGSHGEEQDTDDHKRFRQSLESPMEIRRPSHWCPQYPPHDRRSIRRENGITPLGLRLSDDRPCRLQEYDGKDGADDDVWPR